MARKSKIKGKLIKLLGKGTTRLVEGIKGVSPLEEVVAPSIRKHLRGLAKGIDFVMQAQGLLIGKPAKKKEKKGGKKEATEKVKKVKKEKKVEKKTKKSKKSE